MKPYSQLNTVELVEANLAGEYGDMKIAPDIVRANLMRLKPMLAREIASDKSCYEQVEHLGVEDANCGDFIKHFIHMGELMVKIDEALGYESAMEAMNVVPEGQEKVVWTKSYCNQWVIPFDHNGNPINPDTHPNPNFVRDYQELGHAVMVMPYGIRPDEHPEMAIHD